MKQWKVVVVAFLTAATFWFFNSLNKNYTTSLNYPVEFIFNSDSLISVKRLPENIELDVSGGGWSLLRKTAVFSPSPLQIELQNPTTTQLLSWIELLPIVRDQIQDLVVNQILEDTLSVQIEPRLQKWVVPEIDSLHVDLEEDYRLVSSVSIVQDSILITGPKSFIDTLSATYVFRLEETEIDDDFDESVLVEFPFRNLIRSNPAEVRVLFEVDEFLRKEVRVPIEPMNFPEDSSSRIEQGSVMISYVVQRGLDEEYGPADFVVLADFDMMRQSDSMTLAMLTGFPQNALEVKIEPEIIKVLFDE